jgi:hypothetical protein
VRNYELGLLPTKTICRVGVGQDMEGDITWVAPIQYDDLHRLLDNPSAEHVANVIDRGERHVWPLISQIDTRCLIEFALDDCIRQVRRSPPGFGFRFPAGGLKQQSVATPQAARGWAYPPCRHFKIQSC